jgi:hypothetical protein
VTTKLLATGRACIHRRLRLSCKVVGSVLPPCHPCMQACTAAVRVCFQQFSCRAQPSMSCKHWSQVVPLCVRTNKLFVSGTPLAACVFACRQSRCRPRKASKEWMRLRDMLRHAHHRQCCRDAASVAVYLSSRHLQHAQHNRGSYMHSSSSSAQH